jgi:alkylation response protein AidB-like acyl-CoA dehydrogenase
MDLSLTPEQQAVRELAADFVDREILPHAAEWDRREQVDTTIMKKLGDLGILGLTIPEEHGGSGGDHLTYCLVLEELGRGDSAVRGMVSVSLGLVGKSIAAYGSPGHKREWLPRLCAGESLACFALTEPDTGSDAGSLKTRAERDDDDYLITGSKMFITNGTWADVVLVFARTGGPGHRGVSAFLVPTSAEGLQRREIHGKLGLRGQATAELTFDRVRVPATAMVGPEGKGFSDRRPPTGAEPAREHRRRHRGGPDAGVEDRRPDRAGRAVRHGGVDGEAVRE